MTKVCLLSKFGDSSNLLYEGTRKGLKELDIDFIDINICKELEQTPPHWISIPTLEKTKLNTKLEKLVIDRIRKFKPDHILLLQYTGLPFLFNNRKELKNIVNKGKIALWLVDYEEKINPNPLFENYLDTLLLSNASQLDEYKQKWHLKEAIFMPQAALYLYPPTENIERKFNLGFLGRRQREDDRYKERNDLLDTFNTHFGLEEPQVVLNSNQLINFYQKCKIIIGASWINDKYLYSSDRVFNVLGAGGVYLMQYFPGAEKIFTNKKHLLWFKTKREGIALAKEYLDNPTARFKVATEGYDLVKSKHTYKHRVENVIKILNSDTQHFEAFLQT
jgi:hypothetical protein